MNSFNIRTFAERVGISIETARRWEREGKITPMRTPGGHRRYTDRDVAQALHIQFSDPKKATVLYCRVSSPSQKEDLENQVMFLSNYARNKGYKFEVIKEIGGGMNMNRPKFMKLITGIIDGSIGTIIVAHKDRLARFGFDIVKNLADIYGCEIVVANNEDLSPQEEMVNDLMSIIHTYSCRLYGLRRYRKPTDLLGGDSNDTDA